MAHSRLTPSRRSRVEITNDIVGVREALYDATGSALLAREKCKAEDARIIYEALCRANNVLWTVVEELQAFPSEKKPKREKCCGSRITSAHGIPCDDCPGLGAVDVPFGFSAFLKPLSGEACPTCGLRSGIQTGPSHG